MSSPAFWDGLLVALGVALSSYYSGAEMAAYSLNRARLRLLGEKGHRKALWLAGLVYKRPEALIAMVLVANNLANYMATLFMTRLFGRMTGRYTELYATAALTPILFLLGESGPKSIVARHADSFLYRTMGFLRLTAVVLKPLTLPLEWFQRALLPARSRQHHDYHEFSRARVRHYLMGSAAQGELAGMHGHIGENVIALREKTLRNALVPIDKLVALPADFDYDTVERMARQFEHRRLPVVDGGKVLGAVNVVETLLAGPEGFDRAKAMRELPTLTETRSVFYALRALRQGKSHMAVTLGDGGAPSGVVWVKDLVELVVGELRTW